MYQIKEYITAQGRSPFRRWLRKLTNGQRSKVQTAIRYMRRGLLRDTKYVGGGVYELRLHTGPGYRIYFGRDGEEFIILLVGGDKSSQRRDIPRAQGFWRAHLAGEGDVADSMQDC